MSDENFGSSGLTHSHSARERAVDRMATVQMRLSIMLKRKGVKNEQKRANGVKIRLG